MSNEVWLVIDELDVETNSFCSLGEAKGYAKDIIQTYLDNGDGWPQEILDGAIKIAKITHESTMTNKREVEKDEDGKPINSEWAFMCDCEMVEVKE